MTSFRHLVEMASADLPLMDFSAYATIPLLEITAALVRTLVAIERGSFREREADCKDTHTYMYIFAGHLKARAYTLGQFFGPTLLISSRRSIVKALL